MAAKILANLIVMGSGILARALVQAYRQALANASKSGVAQETLQNAARRAGKVMTEQEARQILGISEETTWEEVLKKYDRLFENNAKNGSFYLQSKVHRAKECLEAAYKDKEKYAANARGELQKIALRAWGWFGLPLQVEYVICIDTNDRVDPRSLNFQKCGYGKPEVECQIEDDWQPPALHFNISRTSSLIACGVAADSPIGIDVEEKQRKLKHHILAFARRYFSYHEVEHRTSI
ncbi:hypothetical protein ACLB2K_041683 [Fragaria x ananassa]